MVWPFPKRAQETEAENLLKKRLRLKEREDRATDAFEVALRQLDRAMAVVAAQNDDTGS